MIIVQLELALELRRITEREAPPAKQGPNIAELLRQAKSAATPAANPTPAPDARSTPATDAPVLREPAPPPTKPAPSMAELLRQPEPAPSPQLVPAQAPPVLKAPVLVPIPALSEWPMPAPPVKPVALAPGRARLSTNPAPTGSGTFVNTIGTKRVACNNGPVEKLAVTRMTS